MKLDITGRNIDVTRAIREFTEEKLSKLDRWIDQILEAHVILAVEKHRHMAEIVVKGRHHTFTGADETGDMYASIGNVIDKLEHQARRQKEKITGRRKHPRPRPASRVVTVRWAPPQDGAGAPRDGMPQIIRTREFSRKPLSVEDAALKILDSDREFLVYRDARSQRISVMYRRKDGNLGLIEPEA